MSREKDVLIAEKVMKWTLVIPASETIAPYFECGLPHMHMRNQQDWHPWTSISDAWLVVEEMIRRNPERDFHLEALYGEWKAGHCNVDVWGPPCKTAPEAICLAALEAVK